MPPVDDEIICRHHRAVHKDPNHSFERNPTGGLVPRTHLVSELLKDVFNVPIRVIDQAAIPGLVSAVDLDDAAAKAVAAI